MTTAEAAAVAERGGARVRPSVSALAGAWLLSSATLVSGVCAYAFQVAAARLLPSEDYGLVAVLWAAMFAAVVVLFRPLEQTTMRTVADRLVRGEETRSVLRAVTVIYVGLTVLLCAAGALAWAPLRDRLFLGHASFAFALVLGIVLYGVQYVVRGACGGVRWFRGYGLALIGDGVVRLAVLAPLAVVASRNLAAAAVAAAAVGGAVAPLLAGPRRLRSAVAAGSGERFPVRAAVAFAAPAAAIALADQILVNGGPLLVMLGGAREAGKLAGIVFAATMIVRVPVFVFQGFAASLLPNLTTMQASGARELRRAVSRAVLLFCAAAAVVVAVVAAVGPEAMHLVYGPEYTASRTALALLGVGVGGYLGTATFSQALLALDGGRVTACVWAATAALFLVLYAVVPGGELLRISLAFAAATMLSLAALALVLRARGK